jgi:hypothetical protein
LESAPATILIPALIAGNKSKLPQFIALALIHHWESLGAIGESAFSYPGAADNIIADSCVGMSEKDFSEFHSPRFVAKAAKVARDFEMSLREFLFPRISLSVGMPRPEDGTAEST